MLKILKRFSPLEWLGVVCCVGLIAFSVFLDLKIPEYTKEITVLVQSAAQAAGKTTAEIWAVGGKMLVCALISFAVTVLTGVLSAFIAASFSRRIRGELFRKVQSFSMEEINKFSTASLITRSTNDVTQIAMLISMGLHIIIKAPIMAVWAIMKISLKNWQWTTATAIAVVVMLISLAIILCVATPRFKRMQRHIDNLNRDMRENLTGLRVVRAYNAESFQEQKFEKSNTSLTNNFLGAIRAMAFMNPMTNAIQNALTLSIYWLGAAIISSAAAADQIGLLGDMVTFNSYSMSIVMSFMMLTMILMMAPRANVSAARINEVLQTQSKILDGNRVEGAIDSCGKPIEGELTFENVSFAYPDAEESILENISFSVGKGETIAFVGSTGSGKSTLINLVPRFYDVTKGSIKVDGVDVREYTQEALRNKLGYVPQRAVLFAGTIAENIAYGSSGKASPTGEEIREAATVAKCADFIEKKPEKYEEHIAQGGANVSGGQKQRLAIARAVARKPEIYIFDDSFSALDFKTDKELRKALKKYTEGSTCLIVAQRIGTVMDADKIVVLEEGKTVGIGTHRQLLNDCEVYRQIALSQLSEEELKNVAEK